MSVLPDKYSIDYMIYSLSGNIEEENILWKTQYHLVVKRLYFKQFDEYIKQQYMTLKR